MAAYTGANSTPVNPPSAAAQKGALNPKSVSGDVKSGLSPLLGTPYRGQGSGNGVGGGSVSSRPAVVIAPPASRVPVPMPTAPQGVQGELSTWAQPGYLSPQESVGQVSVVGDRSATNMKSSDISVVTPVSIAPINFYVPSGRKV